LCDILVTVNAADNKQRDPKGMTTIKIDIDPYVYRRMFTSLLLCNELRCVVVLTYKIEKIK